MKNIFFTIIFLLAVNFCFGQTETSDLVVDKQTRGCVTSNWFKPDTIKNIKRNYVETSCKFHLFSYDDCYWIDYVNWKIDSIKLLKGWEVLEVCNINFTTDCYPVKVNESHVGGGPRFGQIFIQLKIKLARDADLGCSEFYFSKNIKGNVRFTICSEELQPINPVVDEVTEFAVSPSHKFGNYTCSIPSIDSDYNIYVFDLNGSVVLKQKNNRDIDISSQPQGLYVIKYISNHSTKSIKIFR